MNWDLIAPIFRTSYHGTYARRIPMIEAAGEILPAAPGGTGIRDVDIKAGDDCCVFLSPGTPRYGTEAYLRFATEILIAKGAGLRPVDMIEDYEAARTVKGIKAVKERYTFFGDDALTLLAVASLGMAVEDLEYWGIPREAWRSDAARSKMEEIESALNRIIHNPDLEPPLHIRTQYLRALDRDNERLRPKLARSLAWKEGDWAELYFRFGLETPIAVHEQLAFDRMAFWYEMRPPFMEIVWPGPLPLDEEYGYLGLGLDLPFDAPEWLTEQMK